MALDMRVEMGLDLLAHSQHLALQLLSYDPPPAQRWPHCHQRLQASLLQPESRHPALGGCVILGQKPGGPPALERLKVLLFLFQQS